MADILSGLGSLFGSSDTINPSTSLGVNTNMPQMMVPNSVMPLSQQIANMSKPNLVNPMTVTKQGPSLGVDTTIKKPELQQMKESMPIFSDSTTALLSQINKQAEANLKNALPMMRLSQMQQPQAIQQMDLAALLRSLGGNL